MEIKVLRNILEANEAIARENARLFKDKGVFVINVMSSPGAGKTSFILRTLERLKDDFKVAVIEGDIASKVDAEKIQEQGAPAVQINTGGACHLDANMIKNALNLLNLDDIDLLIIENVGNLVCPAEFNLGEDLKLMILSTPEGDDKPLKYPQMFTLCSVLVLNKIDLLNQTNFNLRKVRESAAKLNANLQIFEVSCTTGRGIDNWVTWLKNKLLLGWICRKRK